MKRVLVFGMTGNRGGTEAVVDNYVDALRGRIAFDFLMHEDPLHESFTAGENRTFIIPAKRRNPLGYKRLIRSFFESYAKEYAALWANMNSLSNIDSLKLAKEAGIPRRIVHAHNSRWLANAPQKALSIVHRRQLSAYATDYWACSVGAGRLFFGDSPFEVVPNAFDVRRFSPSDDLRKLVRDELSCGNSLVIGTIGRMSRQKNQKFLVELLPSILENNVDVRLLIVGGGASHAPLVNRARELGVSDRLLLAGMQEDISAFLSAFDVFVLPSLFEGNPVSLMEARSNGLRCVVSDSIEVSGPSTWAVEQVPLADTRAWVESIIQCSQAGRCPLDAAELAAYDISLQKETMLEMLAGTKTE